MSCVLDSVYADSRKQRTFCRGCCILCIAKWFLSFGCSYFPFRDVLFSASRNSARTWENRWIVATAALGELWQEKIGRPIGVQLEVAFLGESSCFVAGWYPRLPSAIRGLVLQLSGKCGVTSWALASLREGCGFGKCHGRGAMCDLVSIEPPKGCFNILRYWFHVRLPIHNDQNVLRHHC